MRAPFTEAVQVAIDKYPKSVEHAVQYGTAGFRYKADDMHYIVYRMGLLATIRTCCKNAGIGLMITASHNPADDNGVKLVDPFGDMLEMAWEKYATDLVNVSDNELDGCIQTIMSASGLTELNTSSTCPVFIAMDTRVSSPALAQAAMDGVRVLDGHSVHYGELTTPQLHYLVQWCNTHDQQFGSEENYFTKLAQPFKQILGEETTNGNYQNILLIDCANGVGAEKARVLTKLYLRDRLNCHLVNDAQKGGILNKQCGADFVKVHQKVPDVQVGDQVPLPDMRCASYDGDADRLVYFYTSQDGTFNLLDGDKIATLVASYLVRLIRESGLDLAIGLVQTAYANGSSTRYIQHDLRMPVSCTKTGVKYLHHEAKAFDVGVYFEANGHGTVLFSPKAIADIEKAPTNSALTENQRSSAERLLASMNIINQTVGDAISDMLLVEAILHYYGWSIYDWNAMYTDLPNRQLKVLVADRNVIQTADAERKTTSPTGLQPAIDDVIAAFPRGRAFARPSGTEDVVRIYAEADTQANADKLAYAVAGLVHDMAGGVGDRPAMAQYH